MTARANSLTERVTKPAAVAPSSTGPASDIRALTTALTQLGYNVDGLLRSIGLNATDLADPDARVPCEMYGALISRAQQERFTPNLALELARLTPIGCVSAPRLSGPHLGYRWRGHPAACALLSARWQPDRHHRAR